MVEVFYRYRVHPLQVRAFEHAYGPAGPFAQLFARYPGFRRVRLFRHREDPALYVRVDVWEREDDWDEFRRALDEDYVRLSRQLALLHLEEQLLGTYEGPDEYREPFDMKA